MMQFQDHAWLELVGALLGPLSAITIIVGFILEFTKRQRPTQLYHILTLGGVVGLVVVGALCWKERDFGKVTVVGGVVLAVFFLKRYCKRQDKKERKVRKRKKMRAPKAS